MSTNSKKSKQKSKQESPAGVADRSSEEGNNQPHMGVPPELSNFLKAASKILKVIDADFFKQTPTEIEDGLQAVLNNLKNTAAVKKQNLNWTHIDSLNSKFFAKDLPLDVKNLITKTVKDANIKSILYNVNTRLKRNSKSYTKSKKKSLTKKAYSVGGVSTRASRGASHGANNCPPKCSLQNVNPRTRTITRTRRRPTTPSPPLNIEYLFRSSERLNKIIYRGAQIVTVVVFIIISYYPVMNHSLQENKVAFNNLPFFDKSFAVGWICCVMIVTMQIHSFIYNNRELFNFSEKPTVYSITTFSYFCTFVMVLFLCYNGYIVDDKIEGLMYQAVQEFTEDSSYLEQFLGWLFN